MKQKFSLSIVQDADLNIREYAELEKDTLSLLSDETYGATTVTTALAAGPQAIIQMLRTPHFFPNQSCSEQLAGAIIRLYQEKPVDAVDILVDDTEALAGKRTAAPTPQPVDADDKAGLDELLADDATEPLDDGIQEDLNVEALDDTNILVDNVPPQARIDT